MFVLLAIFVFWIKYLKNSNPFLFWIINSWIANRQSDNWVVLLSRRSMLMLCIFWSHLWQSSFILSMKYSSVILASWHPFMRSLIFLAANKATIYSPLHFTVFPWMNELLIKISFLDRILSISSMYDMEDDEHWVESDPFDIKIIFSNSFSKHNVQHLMS